MACKDDKMINLLESIPDSESDYLTASQMFKLCKKPRFQYKQFNREIRGLVDNGIVERLGVGRSIPVFRFIG